MDDKPTTQQIEKMKERLNYWMGVEITKKNFNKAAFEILGMAVWGNREFPKCGARFTVDEGYGESGIFRTRDRLGANWASVILCVENEKVRTQLWENFIGVVRKLHEIVGGTHILETAGDVEQLIAEIKKDIEESAKGDVYEGLASFLFDYLSRLASNLVEHKDKLALIKNPEQLIRTTEGLILLVVDMASAEELERGHYELEKCIKFFIAYERPIPQQLKGVADCILQRNKEDIERARESFEEEERALKAYSTEIRRALRAKRD